MVTRDAKSDYLENSVWRVFHELGNCKWSNAILAKAIRIASSDGEEAALIYLNGEIEGIENRE